MGVSNSDGSSFEWDSDGSSFEWDSDGSNFEWEDATSSNTAGAGSSAGPSRQAGLSASPVQKYIDMGFKKEIIPKAIKENGDKGEDSLLDLLIAYQDQDNGCNVHDSGDANMLKDQEDEGLEYFERMDKVEFLVKNGLPRDEAEQAVTAYGKDVSLSELEESFRASQTRGDGYRGKDIEDSSFGRKRKRVESFGRFEPGQCSTPVGRALPADAVGPPFFYYENSAHAKRGVWEIISDELYRIELEYVDSKNFCAATRKRRCIHNLPVQNRSCLKLKMATTTRCISI